MKQTKHNIKKQEIKKIKYNARNFIKKKRSKFNNERLFHKYRYTILSISILIFITMTLILNQNNNNNNQSSFEFVESEFVFNGEVIREPVVAGTFYPSNPEQLKKTVNELKTILWSEQQY